MVDHIPHCHTGLIICILEADGDLTCQAGARWEDLNQTLKDKGIPLFFPVSPGSFRHLWCFPLMI